MNVLRNYMSSSIVQCHRIIARTFLNSCILERKILPPKDVKKKTKPKVPEKTAIFKTSDDTAFWDLPIIVVKATMNNTLVYLTDHVGTPATWTSAGIEGFKNSKRGSTFAAKVAGEAMAKRAEDRGVNRVRVKVKGMGPGRLECVKGLVDAGMDIVSITDITPVPHNGPRPKKQRRL